VFSRKVLPSPLFFVSVHSAGLKVLCFDNDLQVFILKGLGERYMIDAGHVGNPGPSKIGPIRCFAAEFRGDVKIDRYHLTPIWIKAKNGPRV
jgi:hypothetical protein